MKWSVIGHDRVKKYFSKALQEGFSSHAYMLTGPEGIGKRTLALDIVRSAHPGGEPGVNDPFSVVIAPNEKGVISKKEHIEPLRRFISLRPPHHTWTFVVINDAERLSFDAAHSVLKLLEEPPEHVVLFLITAVPGQLIATIRSRCLQVRCTPAERSQVLVFLREQKIRADIRDELARLAGGSIGWLRRTIEQRAGEDAVATVRSFSDVMTQGRAERLSWAKKMADREDHKEWILRWMYTVREQLVHQPELSQRADGLLELYSALGQSTLNARLAIEHFALTA